MLKLDSPSDWTSGSKDVSSTFGKRIQTFGEIKFDKFLGHFRSFRTRRERESSKETLNDYAHNSNERSAEASEYPKIWLSDENMNQNWSCVTQANESYQVFKTRTFLELQSLNFRVWKAHCDRDTLNVSKRSKRDRDSEFEPANMSDEYELNSIYTMQCILWR